VSDPGRDRTGSKAASTAAADPLEESVMKMKTRDSGDVRILELHGKLVLGEPVDTLGKATKGLIDEGHHKLVISLKGVEYVDSAGIGELVAAKKRAVEKKGDVKLLMPNQTVYNVLSMLSLHLIFDIHQDEFKAVHAFAA
jgi:anti-sigma B factor antagonist